MPAQQTRQELNAVGAANPIPIQNSPLKSFQVSGVFSGTVVIEISNNGVDWLPASTESAPVLRNILEDAAFARARCSAYTSGTIVVVWAQSTGA
ncbi:hypothetical protein [Deinococcus peraridilitoris]|uniref:Uncharacterized protein n=1 Tax=Deinococcus peraridilitoris (strain DSM 19664 / LMG 22246 / CIP 109416 / KR-200) TaxID=937777 RepID=K9ZZH0_DEIPD|nr:hypothetical protein [Deinococcus peraridilitoris]AFZ66996.1 hypothetical protein Deipe_1455 [Deinococcus peraridilitoris DSM 19664]